MTVKWKLKGKIYIDKQKNYYERQQIYFKRNKESFDILNLELDMKLVCKNRTFTPIFLRV